MHIIISILLTIAGGGPAGWEIFEDTRFKWQYDETIGLEVELPIFNKEIEAMDGKEVTLTGHYLPLDLDGNRIILSKFPYAQCFFCGGGVGQESVAEVEFSTVQRPFGMDELVTVKGKLKLNVDDYEHLVFMIQDAKVIQL